MARTFDLGYPRIGARRELKRALEGYWKGTLPAAKQTLPEQERRP